MKGKARTLSVHCTSLDLAWTPQPPRTISTHHAHLWYATLDLLRPCLHLYEGYLDTGEMARAQRFLHVQDRERFILGHGLMRCVLAKHLGLLPHEVEFSRGEFGKPFLQGNPIHFNLSDTKDAILLALAPMAIGADIETMNRNTDHARVADHYFTKAEVQSIRDAPDGKRRFLELWTRKEAVLKASGVGLMDDLHNLEVGSEQNRMTISHPDFVRLSSDAYHVYTLLPDKDHPASLAASSPVEMIHLHCGNFT